MKEEIKRILKNTRRTIQFSPSRRYVELFNKEEIQILLDYITNLQQDLDKAIDTIEKNRQFYKCRMDEYLELKKENEKLKNFIINLISELNHYELNGTNKLDIVSDYIKQEYENMLNGSVENETK